MGYAPENCVVIEDSVADVKAGSAARMRVLGYAPNRSSSHHEALIAAGAKLVFDDMRQLIDLLKV